MTKVGEVHVIVPEGIDDPLRPSGGNVYDRRLCDALRDAGWTVAEHPVAGRWPRPEPTSCAALAGTLAALPDRALVLVDGLLASATPDVVVPEAARLRLVVLLHMPLASLKVDGVSDLRDREHAVLSAAAAVITTSRFTRESVLAEHHLSRSLVQVAQPGVDSAELAVGTPAGTRLLSVAAVTPGKGHDLLLEALATLTDLDWACTCVGPLHVDLGFVEQLSEYVHTHDLHRRVEFIGPLSGDDLATAYLNADLLVHPSRTETYGMVVAEALARGVPVVASDVGGVPEAVGGHPEVGLPGVLVRPDDAAALAVTLRRWLTDGGVRAELRAAAITRRDSLAGWSRTAAEVSAVLSEVAIAVPRGAVEPHDAGARTSQQSALIGAPRQA